MVSSLTNCGPRLPRRSDRSSQYRSPFHLAGTIKDYDNRDMNLITLTRSGTILDLDSVAFVRTTQKSNTIPTNGITIGLAGGTNNYYLAIMPVNF
jgi:hypothetical protein